MYVYYMERLSLIFHHLDQLPLVITPKIHGYISLNDYAMYLLDRKGKTQGRLDQLQRPTESCNKYSSHP